VGWSLLWSALATVGAVAAFRGLIDVMFRRVLPWPSLFGLENARVREEDVVNRRRAWFWSAFFRWAIILGAIGAALYFVGAWGSIRSAGPLLLIFPFYFIFNFLILMGPMLFMGISQIRGFEPGDADWGVGLDDVRGQAEAKDEVKKIVDLWQSGEGFVKAGGKRERGILFLGAPGTGKTMLAKAIATGFNSPFITIPGSGFAQTFIGLDAILVRYLARKAKKMARKWGGTCIVFIDEIDAVGMRRSALGGASATLPSFHDYAFYGPFGALNSSGDMILETEAWRERLFAHRQPPRAQPQPGRLGAIVNQAFPGGMFGGGGQLALNQLLVVMDGIDNPPFLRRAVTNWVNALLDASYIVPRRAGKVSLRIPRAKPSNAQIYFIGATNVPMDSLDPALTRPGRLGRHVWFRTPTKQDRQDIFDLYLDRVAHDTDLERPDRREELARITNGYSPAMIEQVCSMALTYAHHEGHEMFSWEHIMEAMTTVESGTAIGIEYPAEQTRAVAIHEAGHAVAAHVYMKGVESTRLTIRMRAEGSLGHHQASEKEERFLRWRSEEMANLVWALGAMAAEHAFYGENSTGVGGDVESATARAAFMVGTSSMGPDWVPLAARADDESEEQARARVMKRYEKLGLQIMNRASGGTVMHGDPIASVLSDPNKRVLAAQLLGQAYIYAYNLIEHNREGVERIADELVERKDIYGDDLLRLLDAVNLQRPEIDPLKEETWPKML
jgi:ATP-dependent Zn protease